jgi:hypothetical protein
MSLARRYPQLHPDLMAGLRVPLLGIAIGMLMLMSRTKGMRLRATTCNSHVLSRYR